MVDGPKMTLEVAETPVEMPETSVKVPVDIPIETDSITQRNIAVVDGPITPIDMIENIKLESYVNKTIVNDNNVVDVPVYQEKDKMLEEVRKMISDPPTEGTTVTYTSPDTTTIQHVPETTTDATTIQVEEITTPTTVIPVETTTSAPETETIFVPIIPNNNENINAYEEKFSVVVTTTSTESSQPVSLWIDFEKRKRAVHYSCFQWTNLLSYDFDRTRLIGFTLTKRAQSCS